MIILNVNINSNNRDCNSTNNLGSKPPNKYKRGKKIIQYLLLIPILYIAYRYNLISNIELFNIFFEIYLKRII